MNMFFLYIFFQLALASVIHSGKRRKKRKQPIALRQGIPLEPSCFGSHQRRTVFQFKRRHYDCFYVRLFFRISFIYLLSIYPLPSLDCFVRHQMSHSLSLEVIEIAEVAALLDKLASGLEAGPSRSTVPSSSAKDRTEPWDIPCCCSLGKRQTWREKQNQKAQYNTNRFYQSKSSIETSFLLQLSLASDTHVPDQKPNKCIF